MAYGIISSNSVERFHHRHERSLATPEAIEDILKKRGGELRSGVIVGGQRKGQGDDNFRPYRLGCVRNVLIIREVSQLITLLFPNWVPHPSTVHPLSRLFFLIFNLFLFYFSVIFILFFIFFLAFHYLYSSYNVLSLLFVYFSSLFFFLFHSTSYVISISFYLNFYFLYFLTISKLFSWIIINRELLIRTTIFIISLGWNCYSW